MGTPRVVSDATGATLCSVGENIFESVTGVNSEQAFDNLHAAQLTAEVTMALNSALNSLTLKELGLFSGQQLNFALNEARSIRNTGFLNDQQRRILTDIQRRLEAEQARREEERRKREKEEREKNKN